MESLALCQTNSLTVNICTIALQMDTAFCHTVIFGKKTAKFRIKAKKRYTLLFVQMHATDCHMSHAAMHNGHERISSYFHLKKS